MRRPILYFVLALSVFLAPHLKAQTPSSSGQTQVVQDPMRRAEPPSATASFDDLVARGDELRAEKAYLDALDYYRAALAKKANSASVYNRMGIVEMEVEHWRASEKEFELAIKADRNFADGYNNLGVDYYELKRYGKAIKEYETAIHLRDDSASYYSNLGAAYFSKKDFEKAAAAYSHALQLDPDIFEHNSRTGVAARLPSPEDRAHYDYVMAKLYAKAGATERALEHLRRAMEEGYKGIGDVYKDSEFAAVRKDPRFIQLMADRPPAISD
jgi:tetratricopeptide (TPR) repeat protein